MLQGILVLSTSEIVMGADYLRRSTGVLERGLADGFIVYVVSLDQHPSKHNKWWLDLLAEAGMKENVFYMEDKGRFRDAKNRLNWSAYYASSWKQLFARLGFQWPNDKDGQPCSWHDARLFLLKQEGIHGPSIFQPAVTMPKSVREVNAHA
ncbi:hypothetical protein HYV73_03030 [Candidatus Uhrbacteria bacterium]|nr:hypothetical protein [Candidatus Uhrbacteria bacterium]